MAAEIDQLALSYAKASHSADDASQSLEKSRANIQRGEDALNELFGSVTHGIKGVESALMNLFGQIAQAQISSGLSGLFGDSSWGKSVAEGLGTLLSGGLPGRAVGGPVSAGTPYLVNEATPRSEIFVPSQSGSVLNVPQAQAALRQSVPSSSGAQSQPLNLHIALGMDMDQNANWKGYVKSVSTQTATQAAAQVSATIPERIRQYNQNPSRR
ncbi:hypothetical protein FGG78_24795 [Thioclava sp. BHET1]|nr:hypothetical protein FGG78_24795 [Thioclava sp. BHET1]